MAGLKELREDLEKFEIRLKKKLGQNFLHDQVIFNRIIDSINVDPSDWVVEIGAGPGILTSMIAKKVHEVVAIEIDTDLRTIFTKNVVGCKNVKIIFDNILKIDLSSLKPTILIGNLPYYCASAIIKQWADQIPDTPAYFMLPEDVIDHLEARPGTPEYTAFSVYAGYTFSHKKLFNVHSGSFYPKPNVISSFVALSHPRQPRFENVREKHFLRVVEGAFAQRRKTIINALESAGFDETDLQLALSFLDIPTNIRGEMLTVEQFKQLAGFIPS